MLMELGAEKVLWLLMAELMLTILMAAWFVDEGAAMRRACLDPTCAGAAATSSWT
jgi:hypothetical protein